VAVLVAVPEERNTTTVAHQIEQFTDGTAAFFTARQDAWHRLGTVTTDCLTADSVMQIAHLGGWDIRKENLHTDSGAVVPNRWATTRLHPKTGVREVLGLVGDKYQIMQNEQVTDLLDFIVDETGAHFETAGSLRGGREVFVTMRLPDHLMVAGIDPIGLYLAMCTSHDGTRQARILVTPVRIVCANTQAAAFANNTGEYTLRHSGDITGKLTDVRAALNLVPVYLDRFQTDAERMIAQQLEWEQLQQVTDRLWPLAVGEPESAYLRKLARDRDLRDLFEKADTQHTIRGTAWAGYQAITEWLDHVQPARSDHHRANKVLTDTATTGIKRRAFALLGERGR
jgi:phage/plasmid-like protein (TIGR03299 family)